MVRLNFLKNVFMSKFTSAAETALSKSDAHWVKTRSLQFVTKTPVCISLPFPAFHLLHPINHCWFSCFNNVWQVQTMRRVTMQSFPASCYFHFIYPDMCVCVCMCNDSYNLRYGVCRFTNSNTSNLLPPPHTYTTTDWGRVPIVWPEQDCWVTGLIDMWNNMEE